jgi:uncharacterized protein
MNSASTTTRRNIVLCGLFFLLGSFILGFFVKEAALHARNGSTYVTVKGLAEREVPADLAIWPISWTVMDNQLSSLQKQIQSTREIVHQFLIHSGFEPAEISNPPSAIADREANADSSEHNDHRKKYRYRAKVTILLRSPKVELVREAMEKSDSLLERGVALKESEWDHRPQFLFTSLNKIKPDMIQEATLNARKAAETFARDSNTTVKGIRNASQGFFEINDRDSSSPHRKMVRVVTTVDYYLK